MSYVPKGTAAIARPRPAPPIRRAAAHSEVRFDPWIILAFLYPLTQMVVFDLVGQLFLMDLLAIPLFVMLLALPDSIERLKRIWPLFVLLALWLAGQVVTDLVRGSRPDDFLRGWAKIVFFAIHIGALWMWLPRRRIYFAVFAIGLGIAAIYTIPPQFAGYEWKFGYDRALIYITLGSLFLITLPFPRMRFLAPLILLMLSFFSSLPGSSLGVRDPLHRGGHLWSCPVFRAVCAFPETPEQRIARWPFLGWAGGGGRGHGDLRHRR